MMTTNLAIAIAVATILASTGSVRAEQESKWVVSVGVSGVWCGVSGFDPYNLRWLDESNPSVVTFPDGSYTTVRIRQSLEHLDSTRTFFRGRANEYTTGRKQFLFSRSASVGIGIGIRVRHPLGVFMALQSPHTWEQEAASVRNYGGLIGYESRKIEVEIGTTVWLGYQIQLGPWPQPYAAFGVGDLSATRTVTQMTNATPPGGVKQVLTESGRTLHLLAGLEYFLPLVGERISLFAEARRASLSYDERFPRLGATGALVLDEQGHAISEVAPITLRGWQARIGMRGNLFF